MAFAPGKIIIFGEHFVVYGAYAIAAAIKQGIYVKAELTDKKEIKIHSPVQDESSRLMVEVILRELNVSKGINLKVKSELPAGIGLGSSAAFTVAVIRALEEAQKITYPKELVLKTALKAEKIRHKKPSGIDTTVSALGGIWGGTPKNGLERVKLKQPLNLILADSGIKRETGKMVAKVRSFKETYPEIFDNLLTTYKKLAPKAKAAIESGDLNTLGHLMNLNHSLLSSLKVSTPKLEHLILSAQTQGALGAKLTGAGGGGSIIALCTSQNFLKVYNTLKRENSNLIFQAIVSNQTL